MRRIAICLAVLLLFSGCVTTEDGNSSISLGPIIGLIGMAVDGDDKDDYEHFFHDDECCCSQCK